MAAAVDEEIDWELAFQLHETWEVRQREQEQRREIENKSNGSFVVSDTEDNILSFVLFCNINLLIYLYL